MKEKAHPDTMQATMHDTTSGCATLCMPLCMTVMHNGMHNGMHRVCHAHASWGQDVEGISARPHVVRDPEGVDMEYPCLLKRTGEKAF